MIITFYSNYLTHHQIPFCEAMAKRKDVEFHFVSTMPMESERVSGGWAFNQEYEFELKAYSSDKAEKEALNLAEKSDVIIIGSAPERYVEHRMKFAKNKLTFRYSERIYKKGRWRALSPRGMVIRFKTYFRYINKPLYMLCASAYTAGDLAVYGSYLGRCYKWGYFPETKEYDIENLVQSKNKNEICKILWAGRLIGWKHPEHAIFLAEKLKEKGYAFRLEIIGDGELKDRLEQMIKTKNLIDCVSLLGAKKAEEVREYMEKANIFLFTSDRNEGWGAVLNESMNSGCAVVASNKIGAVPFLIENGKNGLVYKSGKMNDFVKKVEILLVNQDKRNEIAINAYKAISRLWNAEVASQRFLEIAKSLINGQKMFFSEGVCSKARIFRKGK